MNLRLLKSAVKLLPVIKPLVAQRDALAAEQGRLLAERDRLLAELKMVVAKCGFVPPGHFYSPLPCLDEVHRDTDRIFDRSLRELGGIDLNIEGQLAILERLKTFYPEQPFGDEPREGFRYYFNNEAYAYADAIFLYGMIRLLKPKEIVEIGSGFSSFVMLDTNELFFDGRIHLTCIEPYDSLLRSRMKEQDFRSTEILTARVQDVPLSVFDQLHAGDILFIDSSHVSKVGSDVNFNIFEILPRLRPGVFVHFHDMFFPFEYLEKWFERGWFWNEEYLVRAFLQYNSAFRIVVWNQFLGAFFSEKIEESMPLCLKNSGGGLWIERV